MFRETAIIIPICLIIDILQSIPTIQTSCNLRHLSRKITINK